jgi:hypothetical protein
MWAILHVMGFAGEAGAGADAAEADVHAKAKQITAEMNPMNLDIFIFFSSFG